MIIVFDIGGVLSRDGAQQAELARVLGALSADSVAEAYWGERDAYDLGLPDGEYWGRVAARAGAAAPSAAAVAELVALDSLRWGRIEPSMAALVADLVDEGARLGLLSNAPHALAGAVKGAGWSRPFEHRLFSCELGAAKPSVVAYTALVAAWGVAPGEIVFFDDRPANVAAARACGIDAHVFEGPDGVRAALVPTPC